MKTDNALSSLIIRPEDMSVFKFDEYLSKLTYAESYQLAMLSDSVRISLLEAHKLVIEVVEHSWGEDRDKVFHLNLERLKTKNRITSIPTNRTLH